MAANEAPFQSHLTSSPLALAGQSVPKSEARKDPGGDEKGVTALSLSSVASGRAVVMAASPPFYLAPAGSGHGED